MRDRSIRNIAYAGVVGALYVALTVVLSISSYGPIQFRVAEALCVLPFIYPHCVWGLFIGCIAANLFSPYPMDFIVGPLATLLAACCTMWIGKTRKKGIAVKAFACLPPVVINAVAIGALIAYYMVSAGDSFAFLPAFAINCAQIAIGELVVMYALGLPLLIWLSKSRLSQREGRL